MRLTDRGWFALVALLAVLFLAASAVPALR